MQLKSIRVVLVETSHPGNIGAAARAMKTMGLRQLYLVRPRHYPDHQAIAMSAGADDILEQAMVCDSLEEALNGCHLVIGTSARTRTNPLPELNPSEVATLLASKPDTQQAALVFGREHAGLTNEELLHCHRHSLIPANPDYSSLNLAQAVQIFSYEIRQSLLRSDPVLPQVNEAARVEEVQGFYEHLDRVLKRIHFYKPSSSAKLTHKIKRLFNRACLEAEEVQILRGILNQMEKTLLYSQTEDKEN